MIELTQNELKKISGAGSADAPEALTIYFFPKPDSCIRATPGTGVHPIEDPHHEALTVPPSAVAPASPSVMP